MSDAVERVEDALRAYEDWLSDGFEFYLPRYMPQLGGECTEEEALRFVAEQIVEAANGSQAARIAELETMLRELEWAGHDGTDFCRACYDNKPRHAPDCKLARLLREGE